MLTNFCVDRAEATVCPRVERGGRDDQESGRRKRVPKWPDAFRGQVVMNGVGDHELTVRRTSDYSVGVRKDRHVDWKLPVPQRFLNPTEDGTSLIHATPVDRLGGRWLMMGLPELAGVEAGAYLDGAGRMTGFRLAPRGEAAGEVESVDAGQTINVEMVRSVRLGELERAARGFARRLAMLEASSLSGVVVRLDDAGEIELSDHVRIAAALQRSADAFAAAKEIKVTVVRTGRKGTEPIVYAKAAADYVRLCETGPKPIDRLKDEIGCTSASQVRTLIYRARQMGFLTGGGQGKAGGILTQKAIDLLT
jgi:hypothetical protein